MIIVPQEHEFPKWSSIWTWYRLSVLVVTANASRNKHLQPKSAWELVDDFVHIMKRPRNGKGSSILPWIMELENQKLIYHEGSLHETNKIPRKNFPWDFSGIFVPSCWGKKVILAMELGYDKVVLDSSFISSDNPKEGKTYVENFPFFVNADGKKRVLRQLLT